jgi:hypothetical protein
MTRYTVVWDPDVETPFIGYWVAGDSQMRATLTEIANWVDANLAEDPDKKGRPRSDQSARILAVPVSSSPASVSVAYQIFPADRQVRIICLILRGA